MRDEPDMSSSYSKDPAPRLPYDIVSFLCTDLAGVTRGRGLPLANLKSKLMTGVGWVPISQTVTAFDRTPDCELWGSHDDRRLIPDPDTETRVDFGLDNTPLHFFLSDITNLDGSSWDVCARTFLKEAIADLKLESGLTVNAAFETEFTFVDVHEAPGPSFSLTNARHSAPFGELLMKGLLQAAQAPDNFLPEFGLGQYEVTVEPTHALGAADRSIIVQLLVRDLAQQLGRQVSFSPKITPEGIGNGMHIHFGLLDDDGNAVCYDPAREGGLSQVAGHFAAGVVRHLPALIAFTAPSVISHLRLQPNTWSSAFACLGDRNREAALRICPSISMLGMDIAAQHHFEYRAADITANPYLALAVIVRAGLDGIRNKLEQPPLVNHNPMHLSDDERSHLGVVRLPNTAESALSTMLANDTVKNWFSNDLLTSYLAMRRDEIATSDSRSPEDICKSYARRF